jgi:hypothetical protein
MPGITLTLPIVAGKVEAWRRFCQELSGSRHSGHEACRLQQGITRERMALIETPFGCAAVTTFEADDLGKALNALITSDLPFDRWYRGQLLKLHGISLTSYEQFAQQAPPAENQELLFEWILSSANQNGNDGRYV